MDLARAEHDEALHGAVPILFRQVETDEAGELPAEPGGADRQPLSRTASSSATRRRATRIRSRGTSAEGAKLKLKFRQPFAVKDHYFEMERQRRRRQAGRRPNEKDAGRVLTVRMAYDKLKDEDRKLLDQFVSDTQTWRKEVHGE